MKSHKQPTSHLRTSVLLTNHISAGADLTEWNRMLVPARYRSNIQSEVATVRERAGLIDMSGIKKFWIKGNHADVLVDFCITKDVRFIDPGRGVYAGLLNDDGKLTDDAIVFRLDQRSQNHFDARWLVCTGAGAGEDMLSTQLFKEAQVQIDESLHCLLLQGPEAEEIMSSYASDLGIQRMQKFDTRLGIVSGRTVLIARTSYSGEDGFEIFAFNTDASRIWRDLSDQFGTTIGKIGFDALDILRIEAGLLFFGKDMTGQETPTELGLDFLVENTSDFRGKAQYMSSRFFPKSKIIGVISNSTASLGNFELSTTKGKKVGKICSYCFSPTLNKHIGLAQVDPKEAYEQNILNCNPKGTMESEPFQITLAGRNFLKKK